MKHDSVGRQIRPGDGVRDDTGVWKRTLTVLPEEFWGEYAIAVWAPGVGVVMPPTQNLTITHRSGEPIEEISPLVKDKAGKVIERGVEVQTNLRNRGKVERVTQYRPGSDYEVAYYSDGVLFSGRHTNFTVLPPEPEYTETTLTVRHPKNVDARKAIAAVAELEVR